MPLGNDTFAPPETTYDQCDSCDAFIRQGWSCSNCTQCGECGALHRWTNLTTTQSGEVICAACLRSHYFTCSRCDEWIRDGDYCDCSDDDDEGCDCGCCDSTDRNGRRLVQDYNYKPMPEFRGQGPLYLGPEIEVEVGYRGDLDDCAAYAVERLGDLGYLKHDGSLNNGFEIVCHPMAYDWAMEHFPWEMLAGLHQMGCRTEPDHTGLHVHVSRAAFRSPCHTYRWMKFIHRNVAPVQKIARRKSSQWAAFSDNDRANVKHYAKGGRGDRYQAINPNNADTFELRMFASSLVPDEVQASFGFAAASVEYTRHLASAQVIKQGGWTWRAFRDWVSDRPDYAPLARQMELHTCAY